MLYERRQARKADRQRKEVAQRKRKALEKAAPDLLAANKILIQQRDDLQALNKQLLVACKKYQEMIELLYELNPKVEIALGSGLGLKQAEDKGKAAIEAAEKILGGK